MPRERVPMTTLGTDQSQFSEAPFQRLHNLAIREPGMVEPLPGRLAVAANIGAANYDARRMWALKDQVDAREMVLLRSTGGPTFELAVLDESSAYTPTIASATLLGTPCGLTEARQRVFYAGPRGALVFEEDATLTRMLGMLPPTWLGISGKTTTDAQAVPASSRVAWRATLHRKDDDGYEITSAPSYAVYAESTASITDFTIRVGWPTSAGVSDVRVRENDIVRLWRARAVTAATSTNDRYLLTAERVLSSTDITNRYIDIRDVTPDAALASSEELYTNPGIQGALQANWQLGPCADVAVYNGHTFYVQNSLPSYRKLRVPSSFGYLGTVPTRTHGIGQRTIDVAVTSGSPTATSVSAAELVGLAVGQVVIAAGGGSFAAGVKIQSINAGAGTVTFTGNSGATSASVLVFLSDVLTVNGVELMAANLASIAYRAWLSNLRVVLTFSEVVDGEGLSTAFDIAGTAAIDGVEIRVDSIAPEGVAASDLTISGTNGANYAPSVSSAIDGEIDERLNRLTWSKLDQPDHVPAINELVIGKGEIVRLLSTQDRLLAFCTDGTYAVTGIGPNWNVDRVDKDIVIASQAAADEMNGNAYVYAQDRGLLRLNRGGGVDGLSKGAVQRALDADVRSVTDDGVYEAHVVCDALHDEVGVFFQSPPGSV